MGFCNIVVHRAMTSILMLETRRIQNHNKRQSTYNSHDRECLRRGAVQPDNRVVAHDFLRLCAEYLQYIRGRCDGDETTSKALKREISNAKFMALLALRQSKEGSSTAINTPTGQYKGILGGDISDLLNDMVGDISEAAGFAVCHDVVFETAMEGEALLVKLFLRKQMVAKMAIVALTGVEGGVEWSVFLALLRGLGRV